MISGAFFSYVSVEAVSPNKPALIPASQTEHLSSQTRRNAWEGGSVHVLRRANESRIAAKTCGSCDRQQNPRRTAQLRRRNQPADVKRGRKNL